MKSFPICLTTIVLLARVAFAVDGSGGAPPTVKVFVLAGQSNLAGRGDVRKLPVETMQPTPGILYHYSCSFGADRGEPFDSGGAYESTTWTALQPCRQHPSTPARHFGPELSFARTVAGASPACQTAIIKCGHGGTSLAVDWDPDARHGKRLFQRLLGQVRSATKELTSQGRTWELAAFIWLQGEADSTSMALATAYEPRLARLIARVRAELAAEDLPVLILQSGKGSARNPQTGEPWMPYSGRVWQAQRAVAAQGRRISFVRTEDLPLADGVHFNSNALIELGKRAAQAYLNPTSADVRK